MNKLFAFLCANTLAFSFSADDSDTPSRGVDFGSWYNFAHNDGDNTEERSADTATEEDSEEEEKKEGNEE